MFATMQKKQEGDAKENEASFLALNDKLDQILIAMGQQQPQAKARAKRARNEAHDVKLINLFQYGITVEGTVMYCKVSAGSHIETSATVIYGGAIKSSELKDKEGNILVEEGIVCNNPTTWVKLFRPGTPREVFNSVFVDRNGERVPLDTLREECVVRKATQEPIELPDHIIKTHNRFPNKKQKNSSIGGASEDEASDDEAQDTIKGAPKDPAPTKLAATKPAADKPAAAVAKEPAATKPSADKLAAAAKPAAAKTAAAAKDPAAAKPAATKTAAAVKEPTATKPATAEPAAAKPAASKPSAVVAKEPAATKPSAAKVFTAIKPAAMKPLQWSAGVSDALDKVTSGKHVAEHDDAASGEDEEDEDEEDGADPDEDEDEEDGAVSDGNEFSYGGLDKY